MQRSMTLLITLGSLALALAGCTGGSGGDDGFVTPSTDDQGRYVIKVLPSLAFSPIKAEVPVGATVVFVNEGGFHNAKAYDGSFSTGSPTSDRGEIGSVTFDVVGTHTYRCEPHEGNGMKGTLRVVAA